MSDPQHTTPRSRLPTKAFFHAMGLGWAAILVASLPYFAEGHLHPFVLEKLPLRDEAAFLLTLKVHVLAALIALPTCLMLLSARFRQRFLRLHRWLGRLTALVVLVALVPTGFLLALTARGGVAGTLGFMLSGVIVVVAMLRAVARARAHDHAEHRRAARHVVAQLSVAVTSRVLLAALGVVGIHGDDAYVAALWIPVLASAAVVEAMEGRLRSRLHALRWSHAGVTAVAGATLLAALLVILRPSHTLASESAATTAEVQLAKGLVEPYDRWMKDRASFSRAPRPSEIRARFLDEQPLRDARGAAFRRFALDRRFGHEPEEWRLDTVVGCVYPETGEIFVTFGNGYREASVLLYRRADAAPAHVCVGE